MDGMARQEATLRAEGVVFPGDESERPERSEATESALQQFRQSIKTDSEAVAPETVPTDTGANPPEGS